MNKKTIAYFVALFIISFGAIYAIDSNKSIKSEGKSNGLSHKDDLPEVTWKNASRV